MLSQVSTSTTTTNNKQAAKSALLGRKIDELQIICKTSFCSFVRLTFSLIVTSSLSLVEITFDDTDAEEEDIDDDDVLLICLSFY